MENKKANLSTRRLNRIRTQGYRNYSDKDLSELAFGNRFAYSICSVLLLIGVILANLPILSAMMAVSFLGVILPNHPFDYIYNVFLAKFLNKPKLPPRSKQLKFACTVATIWLAVTIYLFYSGLMTAGYVSGGALFCSAFLVSTIDFCIPSIVYNYIFKYRIK